MRKFLFITFSFICSLSSYAQLPDGTMAPNWTLTDINSNSHTLYDELGQGKTVFMIFHATWSGPDWSYHSSNALQDMYTNNGPSGLNDAEVFFIEADASTTLADLMGTGPSTQGDYVTGTSFPIIDSDSLNSLYNLAYYPTVYKICPGDSLITEIGQLNTTALISEVGVENCAGPCTAYELDVVILNDVSSAGFCDGMAQVNVLNGTAPFYYEWSNGESTSIASSLCEGANWIYVTDTGGCSDTVAISIVQATNNCATFNISLDNQSSASSLFNCDASAEVSVNSGTAPYSYAWSNGETTNPALNLCQGSNLIVVIDSNNCSDTVSFSINYIPEIPEESPQLINAFSPNNDGVNDFFDVPLLIETENKVMIFNSWGDEIRSFSNYNNDNVVWDGTNKSGEMVTNGTYFYVIEIPSIGLKESGWIQVVR